MTVSTTTNRVDYLGNASTATYAFSFPIFAETDLKVYQAGVLLTLTTDYTVTPTTSLDDGPSAGTITLTAGNLGSSIALAIVRDTPATQDLDLVDNDSFPAESVEAALDKTIVVAQQNEEALARAVKLAPSSTESEITVDDLAGNSGKFSRVNSTEDGLEFADITGQGAIGTPISIANGGTNATTIAAARASLFGQTALAIADGGTNAITAILARANLSLDQVGRLIYQDLTDHSLTGATGEVDGPTKTITGGTIGATGRIIVFAWGNTTGNTESKQLRLYLGSILARLDVAAAASEQEWMLMAWIRNTTASAQRYSVQGWYNGVLVPVTNPMTAATIVSNAYGTATIATGSDQACKITLGKSGTGADTVKVAGFEIYQVPTN